MTGAILETGARTKAWAIVALLPLLAFPARGARAEDLSVAERLEHLKPGRMIRVRGANVLMLRLSPAYQPGLTAHVGLEDAKTTLTHLPGPAGEWHVRIANRLPLPLLVPAGEVLLTPQGPSRMTDRPVWIPRGSATFVPVVQVSDPAPEGPYLHRGDVLTPVERTLEDLDALRARIRFRNAAFGAGGHRADDAGAAYQGAAFKARLPAYAASLSGAADGKSVVGVVVVGERGAHFAHIETDAVRFQALWPRLVRAIALDAMLVANAGLAARPGDLAKVLVQGRRLLRMLESPPLTRSNFGRGEENLWAAAGRDEIWKGLTLDGKPVSLTMLSRPPAPGAAPGPGGTGGPETPRQPGMVELERRGPRTLFEERLLDRRRGTIPPVQPPPVQPPPVPPPPVQRPPVPPPPVQRPPVPPPPVQRPPVQRPPVQRPPVQRPPVQRPPVQAPPRAPPPSRGFPPR